MKKTKLLAGLLSLVMASSTLPIMPMTATAAEGGTASGYGDYQNYLFLADFDGTTIVDYDAETTNDRDAIVENYFKTSTQLHASYPMNVTYTTENGDITYTTATGNGTITNFAMGTNNSVFGGMMANNKKYEFSYTVDFHQNSFKFWNTNKNIMSLVIGTSSTGKSQISTMTYTATGTATIGGHSIAVASATTPITVKTIIDTSTTARGATTYVYYDNELKHTYSETYNATAYGNIQLSSKLGKQNDGKASPLSFDNIYMKEVVQTPITLNTGSTDVALDDATLSEGVLTGLPTDVAGYTIDGYFYDADFADAVDVNAVDESKITDNTIYVKLTSSGNSVYTVDFFLNYAEEMDSIELEEGVSYTPPTLEREGYRFLGWYTEPMFENLYTTGVINDNLQLHAKWEEIIRYTITFNYLKDGIENTTAVTNDDMEVTLPSMTTDDGYRILGWYLDEALTTSFDGKNISADDEVFAKWTNKQFYADFATNTGNNAHFKVSDTTGRWTGDITDDGRMAYTRNNVGTKGVSAMNANATTIDRTISAGKTYEFGYTVDFNSLKFPFSWNGLSYRLSGSHVNGYNLGTLSLDADGNVKVQGNAVESIDNIEGDIDVKVIFSTIVGEGSQNNAVVTAEYTHKTEGAKKAGPFFINLNNTSGLASGTNLLRFNNFGDSAVTGDYGTIYFDDIYYGVCDTEGTAVEVVKGDTTETLYAYDGYLVGLATPTVADGEKFLGWFTDDTYTTEFVNGNVKAGDKVYAQIEKGVAVNFIKRVDGAEDEVLETITAIDGKVTLPTSIPSNAPYSLDYWYYMDGENEVKFDPNNVPMDNSTLDVYTAWTLLYMSEDFEDADYITEFDTPTVDEAEQRWTNKVVTGADGNKYMEYSLDTSKTYNTDNRPTVFSVNLSKYTLDTNTRYEFGYKFAMQDTVTDDEGNVSEMNARLDDYFALEFATKNSVNSNATVAAWNSPRELTYQNNYTFNAGTETITVPKADVDGFVTVKTYFNLNRDKAVLTGDDATINVGEAQIYISYLSKATGETVTQQVALNDFAISKLTLEDDRVQAGNYLFDQLTSFKVSEPSSSTGNGFKLMVDDVYLQVAAATAEHTVTFDTTEIPAMSTPESQQTVNGFVTLPEITEDVLPLGKAFAGWYKEDGTRFINNGGITEDITLYAKVIDIKKVYLYTTEEDLEAGTNAQLVTTTTNEVVMPEDPTNAPYFFDGWYVVENGEVTNTVFDPANVTALETIVVAKWKDQLYKFTFDSEEATEASKYAANGANARWRSKVENGAMVYYIDPDYVVNPEGANHDAGTIFNDNTKTGILQNTDYELGYKFDLNTNVMFNNAFALGFIGKTGAYSIGGWTRNALDGTNMHFYLGDGAVTIDSANVNGYITVKYHFNIGTPSEETPNTGNVTAYISWYGVDGVQYNESLSYEGFTTWTEAGGVRNNVYGLAMTDISTKVPSLEDTIILDDVYLKFKPENAKVTFMADGVQYGDIAEADPNGVVALPEDPTSENGTFAGWFFDEEFRRPFNGTEAYEDITVYARWQVAPKASDVVITPTNGKISVNNASITVKFDSEMDEATLSKNNIKFMKDGVAFDKASYNIAYAVEYSETAKTRQTVATITLNTKLDYASEYDLVISSDVANVAGAMDESITKTFTTEKLALVAENWIVTDAETGEAITAVENTSGKTINIAFDFSLAN